MSPLAGRNTCTYAATAKNSIALENLYELDIIFSDKTGTLTKNIMSYYGCTNSLNKIFDNNMH